MQERIRNFLIAEGASNFKFKNENTKLSGKRIAFGQNSEVNFLFFKATEHS